MHNVIFRIGGFEIYSYGFVLVIAFLAGLLLALRQARLEGVSKEDLLDLSFFLLVGGVVGARLLYILLKLPEYLLYPLDMLNLRKGGLSWHGALAGALVVTIVFALRRKKSAGILLDTISPSMMLGLAIGRIGCLLNGCCHGKITNLPWGLDLSNVGITGRRHPTQVYELILDLAAMGLLLAWQKRKRFHGEIFAAYIFIYSAIRFFVEFFRESAYILHGLSIAQYSSLILFAAGGALILRARAARGDPHE